MKKILIIFSIITFFASGAVFAQHEGHTTAPVKREKKTVQKQKDIYYCPMHPSYTSDRPGDCPICNMKLVKKEDVKEAVEPPAGEQAKGSFYVSQEQQQLIGVKTGKISKMPLNKIIRTVGRVAFDPDLYTAQQEFIETLNTLESIKGSGQEKIIENAKSFVEAAKLKLRLQGLDINQIEELEKSKENDLSLLISSGSPYTWVYATIYEYELEWIKLGQGAIITSNSYPLKEFKGKILAIDPVFDPMTRSVRARIKVENTEFLLKPEMYVDVSISSELGIYLVVPKEAVMDSGLRKIAFLSLDQGHFKPVEIKTGVSSEDYLQVLEGLNEGDNVVISGNFLLDSESKLKSAFHQHGQ